MGWGGETLPPTFNTQRQQSESSFRRNQLEILTCGDFFSADTYISYRLSATIVVAKGR